MRSQEPCLGCGKLRPKYHSRPRCQKCWARTIPPSSARPFTGRQREFLWWAIKGLNNAEIGQRMDITRERARQLRKAVEQKAAA